MNDKLRRDSLITIIGLSIVVALFTFVVYLPGLKSKQQLNQEIDEFHEKISAIPTKVKQLEELHQQLNQRIAFIDRLSRRIPVSKDSHQVLQRVALLAKTASLTVSELNPGETEEHATYTRQPFKLSITGQYAGLLQFLNDLDKEERLFTVNQVSVIKQDGDSTGLIKGSVDLSVYALRENQRGYSDFSENRVSKTFISTDKR
ncbi:type IV pilus inner membrane component PilO [Gimesia algae]|uniref:Pilus assembly protein, PilO n=1 Tax=Gimesia algae TaxID=2527971 RepID=A0A517VNH3_9PLAN|nr:type 4a pilus biogenesis protein PilO [Gimesia algae]QDT94558.1 Pilus assembly protein, PilO [Gimesia algae]